MLLLHVVFIAVALSCFVCRWLVFDVVVIVVLVLSFDRSCLLCVFDDFGIACRLVCDVVACAIC